MSGDQREAQIGDLLEQFQRGRSATWFWRQTINGVFSAVAVEVWQHKVVTIAVTVVGIYLPDIYMRALTARLFRGVENSWYLVLLDSSWSWLVLNPWSYRLELRALASRLLFCAFAAMTAWIATRWNPRQRGLVTVLLVAVLVGQCLPHLWFALRNWLHDPTNPMWFFLFFWFLMFACVAIPCSVRLGAASGPRVMRGTSESA